MYIPPSGMVNHPGPNLHKPPDDRVYGRLDALTPECTVADHAEQIVGRASYRNSCLIPIKFYAPRGSSCPI